MLTLSSLRVFENRVLRKIFGPRRDEVMGEWRKLENEELNDLYCSPNIIQVIKSRRLKWAGHVARMGEGRGEVYKIFLQVVRWEAWTGLIWFRRERGGRLL